MKLHPWTVARFQDGSWSSGGPPDLPEYEGALVWVVQARDRHDAEKQGRALYRNQRARERRAAKPVSKEIP